MAKSIVTKEEVRPQQNELFLLEQRKVKALEKIANTMDALTVWFEEIDKDDWSSRVQYYLSEFHKLVPKEETDKNTNA